MPNISRLFDFQPGQTALSAQVDAEFNQLISTINGLPDKDGTLQTNLNADLLDGFHASNTGGTNKIPVCVTGNIQVNLNADLLDGQHASDIAAAAFDIGTKILFYQAAAPSGWTIVAAPTDHVLRWKTGAVGGTTEANSWTITGFTTTVANHTLVINELPAHWHDLGGHTHNMGSHTHSIAHTHEAVDMISGVAINYVVQVTAGGTFGVAAGGTHIGSTDVGPASTSTSGVPSTNNTSAASGNTGNAGSDVGHNHTATTTESGVWRPPTAYIIIASKD